jgi:NADPH:quinone reductase-like Zn-dependent oxidoreductase
MSTIRRVFVGNRACFEAMNRAVTQARLRPIIDRKFAWSDFHEGFIYFSRGKSFGRVVVSSTQDT